jgi:drug/metabolite transporter (DMT)-like permease
MSGTALVLLAAAAVLHPTWNLLTKQSRDKLAFIWCFLSVGSAAYLPGVAVAYGPAGLRVVADASAWVLATGLLHALYFLFLALAYEAGDLSVVYPLMRGLGPLLVALLAPLVLGEELSAAGIAGIALVLAGIYTIHLQGFRPADLRRPFGAIRGRASAFGLLTAATIPLYSLVDKVGVARVPPFLYVYAMFVLTVACLTPVVWPRRRAQVRWEWTRNRASVCVVGVVSLGTYLLVLMALRISKVSYLVAAREMAIVFGAILGTVVLKEGHGAQKTAGSLLIAAGVGTLALAR